MAKTKGLKFKLSIYSLLFVSSMISPILSQAQVNSSTLKLNEEEQNKLADRFKISASLETNSNMFDKESPDRQNSNSLDLISSYYLGSGYSIGARQIVDKDEKVQQTTFSNTTLTLKKAGPKLTPNLGSSFALVGVAPTNEDDRKQNKFQGGARLVGQLKGEFKKLTYTYTMTGNRNFHQYTQAGDGTNNVQYGLANELTLEFEFVPHWTLAATGLAKTGWTYQGSSRQSYGNEFSLSNEIGKQFSLAVGFRNEGAAFKADGVSSNIKVFDQNSTVVFASMTVTN